MRFADDKGFLLSLEPAITLLLLLFFIVLIYSQHLYLPFQDYSSIIAQMHETDVWLVEDSIGYYNMAGRLEIQKEWMKKELLSPTPY